MTPRRLRTRDYSKDARNRLGEAVVRAREAAGFKYRTHFAKAAGGINVRSLEMLENGDEGVGQSILFAVARALPNWTEDTPRRILEDEHFPIPPTAQEIAGEAGQVYNPETDEFDPVAAVLTLARLVPQIRKRVGDKEANGILGQATDLAIRLGVLSQVAPDLEKIAQG